MVYETVTMLRAVAAGAVQALSDTDQQALLAAQMAGEDRVSRCSSMFNRFLATETDISWNSITGVFVQDICSLVTCCFEGMGRYECLPLQPARAWDSCLES
jgi:hypothetical protein